MNVLSNKLINFNKTNILFQIKVEGTVEQLFKLFEYIAELEPDAPELLKTKHVSYLKKSLIHLTTGYECLDASRPWLCYWILHALELLEVTLEPEDVSKVAQFLKR